MVTKRTQVLFYSLLGILFLGGLIPVGAGNSGQATFCERVKPCQLLGQSDAERLLGQKARLTQDTSQLKGDIRQCLCAYVGVTPDQASGQNSMLFFALDQREASPSAEQARQVLVSTKEANEHDTEILDLKGVGDEAFLLSNDSSSHLLMARKGGIIMRLQVKRAAGTKSAEELKAFAERAFKQF